MPRLRIPHKLRDPGEGAHAGAGNDAAAAIEWEELEGYRKFLGVSSVLLLSVETGSFTDMLG
jgi:hypothetical protein